MTMTLRPLYFQERTSIPINYEAGCVFPEEIHLLPMLGFEPRMSQPVERKAKGFGSGSNCVDFFLGCPCFESWSVHPIFCGHFCVAWGRWVGWCGMLSRTTGVESELN